MPKPSKNAAARNYKKPEPAKQQTVKLPNYSTRKKLADAALKNSQQTIAKYQNPNSGSECVYNKGFTGLKVGG